MAEKRKIGVFTGNRAEFSMLIPIIKCIAKDSRLEYCLIVSGAHLEEIHGNSVGEIENEGFEIHHKLPLEHKGGGNALSTTKVIGEIILKSSDLFAEIQLDLILIASDRFESFGALVAATQMNIPTAHFEGGDITQGGALDDSLRHAMTKLSHIHFTTNSEASQRLLRMGEEEQRVINVGFPGIDAVASGDFMKKNKVVKNLSLDLNKPIVLFTQHSITSEPEKGKEQVIPSIEALEDFQRKSNGQVIITYPNNDAGGELIIKELEKLRAKRIKGFQFFPHLGRHRYYGLLNILGNHSRGVVVGNSSSGIKETPLFNCPSIIIGNRQDGRLRGSNVITVDYNRYEIFNAINKCVSDENFRKSCGNIVNPYGSGNSGKLIAKTLSTVELGYNLLNKKITY